MGTEIPPELGRVLRRLDDTTEAHKDRLDFIQGRWATLRRPRPPDPEEVRRIAERADASPELRAIAAAVRAGKTTWAKVVAGESGHLPEVAAFSAAERARLRTVITGVREAGSPRRGRVPSDDSDDSDEAETVIFEQW